MTSRNLLYRAEGDTGPDLFTTLEGIVLSTLGGITVEARRPDAKKLSKPIVVDDDAGGEFHIVWDPGDLIEGDTMIDYVIVDAGGFVDRLPEQSAITVRVRPRV